MMPEPLPGIQPIVLNLQDKYDSLLPSGSRLFT